jgi:hypothetical protein
MSPHHTAANHPSNADLALLAGADDWHKHYPGAEALTAILGKGWAIARKTPRNLARYGRCITRREYEEAARQAVEAQRRQAK